VEEVLEEAQGGTLGRPHVARVLVRHGYADSINDVFKHYLVKGKPGYVRKERIKLRESVSLIKGAGGQAVVAHPVSLNYQNYKAFEELLNGFIAEGIDGIEVYASMHNATDITELLRLASKYSLAISGGSDYHGDKEERIGYYHPERPIPFEIYPWFEK
jgi:predicted metal-dependent phosphoesterase TrpH